MKIQAISDLHGYLPDNLAECDVLVICGDIIPATRIQNQFEASEDWFNYTFIPWVKDQKCKHVVFIAGNHDFWLCYMSKENRMRDWIASHDLTDKLIYLNNSSATITIGDESRVFYGTPQCTGPFGWAFVDPDHIVDVPHCDVLISHQPPKLKNVGVSLDFANRPDFGSDKFCFTVGFPRYWFCGHIHSGDHKENVMTLDDGSKCSVYNVSYINEAYRPAYSPVIVDL